MLRIAVVDDLDQPFRRNSYRKNSSVEGDSYLHRRSVSLALASASPSSIIKGVRKSFSYSMLPEEPIKLSVLKLDNSRFDIEVMQTATVGDLRQAVETVFSHMPKKGPGKISWAHVWGRFCLCYEGHKLVLEREYIRNYGIKDGDQLKFIRHVSSRYNMKKSKSKRKDVASNQNNPTSSEVTSNDDEENYDEEDLVYEDMENGRTLHKYNGSKDKSFKGRQEFGLTLFLGGWFSYSKLSKGGGKSKNYSNANPLRSSYDIFNTFKTFIGFCGAKRYSQRDTPWRLG
ncbi:hypothetical protein ACFE04_017597 [Oxalis oulophora]